MGIEPTSEAWEASNNNLKALELAALSESDHGLNRKTNGKRKVELPLAGLLCWKYWRRGWDSNP
jgi:hypothetical protein